ncbi:protein I'm not dead yet-like isoform X2 [Drosophila serrata]|uniref:protein I'm not dead yet-like isoform X2 n=1 Tax=Drosophila serrata TaxID=7274 RepID=UPI000A1D2AF4|nr:protein I'm not dead yet-like isoform X2 [Drosophila serrata]
MRSHFTRKTCNGAVALAYVVFAPIAGIADSPKVCTAYYTDILFLVYGCCFLAITMQSSRLHEHLAFIVIRCVGSNITMLQLFLAIGVFVIAFLANPTAAVAFWITVAKAVLTEYDNAGVLKMNSEEKLYEPGGAPYPTLPVVGIYLTLCYTATLAGAVSPIVNPNSNIIDAFVGQLKFEHIILIMIVPIVMGLCVMILWIQIIFLGLLGGPIKRELKELSNNATGFQESIEARKQDLGPWKVNAILSFILILIIFIIMHTRKPRIYPGWDDISPTILSGYSVQSLGVVILFAAIPANFLFCRYYACRRPDKPGTAPSLLGWKAVNKRTPWGEIIMLGAAFCCVFCAKESGLYKAIAKAMSEPRGDFLQFLCGACYGTLFTILSPAAAVARLALPIMRTAGNNFALPFATALHNQFMLPISAPANTIVSGLGNVRPFLFLFAGIIPTLFMMVMITTSTCFLFGTALPKDSLKNMTESLSKNVIDW